VALQTHWTFPVAIRLCHMRDSEPYASPNENDNKPDGLQTSIKIHNS